MTKTNSIIPGNPKPGNICQKTGRYVMVFSYYRGGYRILGKNVIKCIKGRRFPPYRKLVLLPNHVVLLTSKLKCKGYLLIDKRLY